MRVCFVCLGNICRSPAAEAILARQAAAAGLDIEVDSAGTSDYHVDEPPHDHTLAEAARRGIPLDHAARQFTAADFARYDLVIAMDEANELHLLELAPDEEAAASVVRLGAFNPDAKATGVQDVADPWGREAEAYTVMFDQLEQACAALVRHLVDGTTDRVPRRRD